MNFGKIFSLMADKNINQGELFSLIDTVRTMDLSNESNLRDIIKKVSTLANINISPEKESTLISKIQKDGIPDDIFTLFK